MIRRIGTWLEERTGIPSAICRFADEEIPASGGWAQVFGSVALFLLFTQAFTGILLSLNFAPSPGEAYNSLRYIVGEVSGGRMIRGLHYWGASMMIVVVALHMAQVFLYGAYKKPREATWMAGIALLVVTLAFGLTGYLLPWDNRAYWGTVVTTQIAGHAPFFGPYVERVLGADSGIGVLTYARFYALHTMILPAVMFSLAFFHVYLVLRHGAAPGPLVSRPATRFFPAQAFKDTCAIFAAFVALFVLAATAAAPLERIADPTDTTYIPRPEWYFLFLFQILKGLRGLAEQVGSVLLPTLAVALLFAVPFLDRSKVKRVTERTAAIAIVAVAAAAWSALTAAAVLTTPRPAGTETAAAPWARLTPQQLAGLGWFRQANCSSCHNLASGPPKAGPDLAHPGTAVLTADAMSHMGNQSHLDHNQLDAVASFLRKLTPENADALAGAPADGVAGAQVVIANGCLGCHSINGPGGAVGPPLNGVSRRRTKDWAAQHLRDPQSQTPGTPMPPFQLSEADRDHLVGYLFSLP